MQRNGLMLNMIEKLGKAIHTADQMKNLERVTKAREYCCIDFFERKLVLELAHLGKNRTKIFGISVELQFR